MDSNSIIMMRKMLDYKVSELRRLFRRFDPDDIGIILLSDVKAILESCGLHHTDDALRAIFENIGVAGSKYIYFEEFIVIIDMLMAVDMKDGDDEAEVRHIFDIFDRDSAGFITAGNLRITASLLGIDVTSQEAEDMMAEYDTDGDGRLTYDEFTEMMNTGREVDNQ